MTSKRITKKYRILPDGPTMKIVGRDAWQLDQLIKAGKRGVTSMENPAPRVAHYIFKLRGFGFVIETIDEAHGGPYPGHHARYVLHSDVVCLDEDQQEAA